MSVLTAQATASGTLFTGRGEVVGIMFVGAATAGTVVLKDGGTSGNVEITINTAPITTSGTHDSRFISIPDGLLFQTDCYLTLTTATACTILYKPMK